VIRRRGWALNLRQMATLSLAGEPCADVFASSVHLMGLSPGCSNSPIQPLAPYQHARVQPLEVGNRNIERVLTQTTLGLRPIRLELPR
jgi:hypothetical protein